MDKPDVTLRMSHAVYEKRRSAQDDVLFRLMALSDQLAAIHLPKRFPGRRHLTEARAHLSIILEELAQLELPF